MEKIKAFIATVDNADECLYSHSLEELANDAGVSYEEAKEWLKEYNNG